MSLKKSNNASVASRNMCDVFGQNIVSECTLNDDALITAIELNQFITTRDVAVHFGVS